MNNVKKIIEEKNELVINMAFSSDENEVKDLIKKIRNLENDIMTMTYNSQQRYNK